ncbi:MAG: copper ion binding protein, partial [Wenzhouxiangella sp.]
MNESTNHSSSNRLVTLVVPGMGSDHCAGIVRESIERLDGIESINTSISSHKARVAFDPDSVGPGDIRRAVEKAGYEVNSVSGDDSAAPVRLTVPGMGSDHCAGLVRDSLERLDGIEEIRTNISNH